MPYIIIEVKSCKECPHFKTMNLWSSDGWDRMEDWCCTKHSENSMRKQIGDKWTNKEPGKLIQGGVEWYEESEIKIPEWCPIMVSNIS